MNEESDVEKRRERLKQIREKRENEPEKAGRRRQPGQGGPGGRFKGRRQQAGGAGGGNLEMGGPGAGKRSQPMAERILTFITTSPEGGEKIAGTSVYVKKLEKTVLFLNKMKSAQRGGKLAEKLLAKLDPQEIDGQFIFDPELVKKFVEQLETAKGKKRGAGLGGGRQKENLADSMQNIQQMIDGSKNLAEKWSEQFKKMSKEILDEVAQKAENENTDNKLSLPEKQ